MISVPLMIAKHWKAIAVFAVVGGALAFMGWQHTQIADLEADLAKAGQDASNERLARETAAREHIENIAALQAQHAANQQLLENQYAEKMADLAARRAADRAEADRLRGTIATFTARDRRPGETHTAALERAEDRLATLGRLLEESVGLVIEGRGIIERRDAEVKRLVEQINLDRQACSKDAAQRQATPDSSG